MALRQPMGRWGVEVVAGAEGVMGTGVHNSGVGEAGGVPSSTEGRGDAVGGGAGVTAAPSRGSIQAERTNNKQNATMICFISQYLRQKD